MSIFHLQFWAAESCMAVWVLHDSLLHWVFERGDFLNTDISQGSVAMHLIVMGSLIIILLEICWRIPVSERILKMVKIWWSYCYEFGVFLFWNTVYLPYVKYCALMRVQLWLLSCSAFSMWCMQGVMISTYSTSLVMLSSTATTSFDAHSTFYNNYWVIVKRGGMEMVQVIPWRRTLASSPESECTSCHQQGHTGSKTFLQQNPPVLNWGWVAAKAVCPV